MVPSSRDHKRALHQIPYGIHHRHIYPCSTIFTILAQDSKADGGNLDIYTELPIYVLWCERNNHILVVSSGDNKNK